MPKNTRRQPIPYSQVRNVVKKREPYTEMYERFAKMQEALGESGSSLPAPATKAQRIKAVRQRLFKEERDPATNATRRAHLKMVLKKNYKLNTDNFDADVMVPIIKKYIKDITDEQMRELFNPFSNTAEGARESRRKLQQLLYATMDEMEKNPSEVNAKEKGRIYELEKYLNPFGMPRSHGNHRGGAGGILRRPNKPYTKKGSIQWEFNGPRMKDLMPVLERHAGLSKERLRQILTPVANPAFSKKNAMRRIIFRALQNLAKEPESDEKKKDEKILRSAAKYAIPTGVIGYANLPNRNATPQRSQTPNRNTTTSEGNNGGNFHNRFLVSKVGGTRRAQRGGACPCSAGLPPIPLLS